MKKNKKATGFWQQLKQRPFIYNAVLIILIVSGILLVSALAMHFGTRSAEAFEIADIALFLASDEAAVVNGAIVTADSGLISF